MIEYSCDGKFALVDGYRFVRDDKTGYYLCTQIKGNKRLHRYIWEKYNGKIPDGYHIHHKDHDKSNNDINNLELLSAKDHLHIHNMEATDEFKELRKDNLLSKAVPASKEWHRSEIGSDWHKQHYEEMKDKLHVKTERKCDYCGKTYIAINNGRNRFCSNACSAAARRKSGVDNETRICEWCGKEFIVNRYSKSKTCSASCRNYFRWNKKRKEIRS